MEIELTKILRLEDNPGYARLLAKKILEQFTRPFQLEVGEAKISPSIGISLYPKYGEDAETLIKNADIAIQEAKSVKNAFKFYVHKEVKSG
jgi:GGDEF domain-containing protein